MPSCVPAYEQKTVLAFIIPGKILHSAHMWCFVLCMPACAASEVTMQGWILPDYLLCLLGITLVADLYIGWLAVLHVV